MSGSEYNEKYHQQQIMLDEEALEKYPFIRFGIGINGFMDIQKILILAFFILSFLACVVMGINMYQTNWNKITYNSIVTSLTLGAFPETRSICGIFKLDSNSTISCPAD